MIRFGPSGNSDSFYEQGNKSSLQMPLWLKNMGLNAYEYQCNKGVKISKQMAEQLGNEAKLHGIFLSIHAPYYISMASIELEKRVNSQRYIISTLQAAKWMGAKRIVIHTGSIGKGSRELALQTAIQVLRETIVQADEMGFADISICPELLGKINQLGTLEEILEMCKIDERIIPTIDFGHLHARGMGCLNCPKDFEKVLDQIENSIGYDRLKTIHSHFSRIEYSTGGEKKHWTLSDTQFGPNFEHLAEVLVKKKMEPVIICESRGCMAEDALKLKVIYDNAVKEAQV